MILKNGKYQIILVFIIISNTAFSNDTSKHNIYLDLIQIIGMYNSSINVGYVYETKKHASYGVDIGVIIPGDAWVNTVHGTGRMKGRGFEVGLSCDKAIGIFTSYTYHKYVSSRLIPDPNVSLISELDLANFDVLQQVFSSYLTYNGSYGEDLFYGRFTVGIGIRFIHIEQNSSIPLDELKSTF